jgi:hypothetical protein
MATKLTHEIRREITIGDEAFTVVISPQGLKLSRKRFRSGRELSWETLWREGAMENGNGSGPTNSHVPGGTPAV